MRARFMVSLLAATAATSASPATAAGANQLGDGGFERPVVSGKVKKPAGSFLGHCTPLASGPGHCWLVTGDKTALIHDDFVTGGVAWAPEAGHQLLWLSPPPATGGTGGGAVKQDAVVPPSTALTIQLFTAADPSTPAGTHADIKATVDFCNDLGTACANALTAVIGTASTGDPAAPDWLPVRFPVSTNADQSLARVRIKTSSAAPAAALVDAVSLR